MSRLTLCLLALCWSSPLVAFAQTTIDFETDGEGNPFTAPVGTFSTIDVDEYAELGILIDESELNPGRSVVTPESAEGSGLSGYHLLVTAVANVDTWMSLDFPDGVREVSFDWAAARDVDVTVTTFDALDNILLSEVFAADGTYVNTAGFIQSWGDASIASAVPIARVLIEPNPNSVLRVDNISFAPVAAGPVIEIDIKPGADPNRIDLFAVERIPVAILGSEVFDVGEVDLERLAFGPGGAAPLERDGRSAGYLDIDDDGHLDLVSFYSTSAAQLAVGDTQACLAGQTVDGPAFNACDAIVTMASSTNP